MKLQLTNIEFDLTSEDVGENVDVELLQERLQNGYIGRVFEVEDEDEIADAISDQSGWCVLGLNYVEVD